jgi:hypothetical protein
MTLLLGVVLATLAVPVTPWPAREARALQCPEHEDLPPSWPHRFLEPYPRNALVWADAGLPCAHERRGCTFVSAEGERRSARVTTTFLGSGAGRGGWIEARPRRPFTPGRWTLIDESRRYPESWQEIEVVDHVDREPPSGGALRTVDWVDDGELGVAVVFTFDTVQDESPVRVELELLPQDGALERYRSSRALLDLATADTLARNDKLRRDRLIASVPHRAADALRAERGAAAVLTWNPCTQAPLRLPRGGGSTLLRVRVVDAAGNGTPWEEHTVRVPERGTLEHWVP